MNYQIFEFNFILISQRSLIFLFLKILFTASIRTSYFILRYLPKIHSSFYFGIFDLSTPWRSITSSCSSVIPSSEVLKYSSISEVKRLLLWKLSLIFSWGWIKSWALFLIENFKRVSFLWRTFYLLVS